MKTKNTPSKIALIFVLVIFGGSFLWWFKSRPSFLLYQAHSQVGKKNQSAVVARYEKLLKKENLDQEEEIRLRLALGEFYLGASDVLGTVVLRGQRRPYDIEHPFIDKAKREFDRILELDEKNARAHFLLGRLLLYKRLERYAIDELELALTYDPKMIDALYWLSLIHQDRDQYQKAKEYALQALAIHPHNDFARWALVQSHSLLGEPAKAIREYNKLSESFKRTPRIRSFFALDLADQNRWIEAEGEMAAALSIDEENHWVRINQARLLMKKGNLEEAYGHLAFAEKRFLSSPWPKFYLAQVNARVGACYESSRASQILVELLPTWPSSHLARAWSHLCLGKEKDAQLELEEAMRIAPKFVEARRLLAQMYLDKSDFNRLGPILRPWLDEKLNQAEAYSLLSESLFRQNQYELSKEMATSAIQVNQLYTRSYIWLGLSRARTNDWEAAERSFQTALGINDEDPTVMGGHAWFKAEKKDWAAADRQIRKALMRSPRDPHLWTILGRIDLAQGFYSEAIQSLQQAVTYRPYLLEAYLLMMKAYWEKGDQKALDPLLGKVLEINSKHPEVLLWRATIRRTN